ncbi:MAG: alpha/beta fold hydrolase [Acidobacteriota bacterium]
MQRSRISKLLALAILFALSAAIRAQQPAQPFAAPDDIDYRKANVMSEGVRLTAELYSLKSAAGKQLPTIIMSHGWGGTAAALRREGLAFARAGYLVIAFDYRGWGGSDSRVVLSGTAPSKKDGNKFSAEVMEIREVVDPLEQTQDIFNVIHWAMGEPQVDKNRIGLWGSSYSGGHVVYVAAHDPRVKCIVSQVGAMDSRPAAQLASSGSEADQYKMAYEEATKRARGDIGYPPPRARVIGNLQGAPIREKLLRYSPVDAAAMIKNCAMLFVVAEKEELFDNAKHAKLVYDRAREPKKYVVLPGITHYGIYTTAREQAIKIEIEWYDQHLKK